MIPMCDDQEDTRPRACPGPGRRRPSPGAHGRVIGSQSGPSSGPRPPTRSSTGSAATAHASPNRLT